MNGHPVDEFHFIIYLIGFAMLMIQFSVLISNFRQMTFIIDDTSLCFKMKLGLGVLLGLAVGTSVALNSVLLTGSRILIECVRPDQKITRMYFSRHTTDVNSKVAFKLLPSAGTNSLVEFKTGILFATVQCDDGKGDLYDSWFYVENPGKEWFFFKIA